jgi:hypothetical protein
MGTLGGRAPGGIGGIGGIGIPLPAGIALPAPGTPAAAPIPGTLAIPTS